jgi:heme exporter protein C
MDIGKYERIVGISASLVMLLAVWAVFFYLPPMKDASGSVLGDSFRIFYFHMPIAIITYLAFTIVFLAGIQYLRSRNLYWDMLAASSAEIGLIFAFLVLVTGSIWAKEIWGWYWIWEPRLTTSLVLFLVYAVYLLLRSSLDGTESRARLSAVFGIMGFISVPLSFLSIRLWRSIHPLMFGNSSGGLEGTTLWLVLLLNMAAFLLVYVALLVFRMGNERLRETAEELKNT